VNKRYSILELATVASGNTVQNTFNNSLDLAAKAEQLGYYRFWLAEHHNMKSIASSATSVLMGYIAGGTKSIRVGSGGVMLPNHAPLMVAEQFATLASLYPNRIDMGLGRAPGTDQATAYAIRPDRLQAVYQFPDEIAQLKKYFSKENKHAKVRVPIAEGLKVPMYILGSSTDSAWLAAKLGLPYAFASHFAPAHLMEALKIYRNNFQPSSQLDNPYTIGCINVIAADTQQKADDLSTSLIRLLLGVMTNNLDYMQPPVPFNDDYNELLQNPAFERMLKYAFVGDKRAVTDKMTNFFGETGVDEVMVVSHIYDHQDRVSSYSLVAEIMKEVNQAELVE
jgi:luciferase family oxidoreductase group 1